MERGAIGGVSVDISTLQAIRFEDLAQLQYGHLEDATRFSFVDVVPCMTKSGSLKQGFRKSLGQHAG
jgi:hypothetical protein